MGVSAHGVDQSHAYRRDSDTDDDVQESLQLVVLPMVGLRQKVAEGHEHECSRGEGHWDARDVVDLHTAER